MATTTVFIVLDADDPAAATESVACAADQLAQALTALGIAVQRPGSLSGSGGGQRILITGGQSAPGRQGLSAAGLQLADAPEALAIAPTTIDGQPTLLATGSDARGLTYAVLELADRAAYAESGEAALHAVFETLAVTERPANEIRSMMRLFTSDIEDLGWYHDRRFWAEYLAMLATQRFNRFHLALGIGFDFARNMLDSYFYFPYPFLLSVPGYDVYAVGITDEERDRNLETLRFIAAETKRHGLQFQLGLWAHVYVFQDSPDVNHPMSGLTAENHAEYCRDALAKLLQTCPDIDGLTFRVHGESGIPEGSYGFWRTLFSAVANCGRRMEIDMHAKGIDQGMIDVALETQQPVVISPKFWAEHMGLPYHQADIRAVEQPGPATGQHATLMAFSAGSRRFTRYGYADLLTEDRPYGILWRVWPGTNRLLLWGDPLTGAAYSRAFSFSGSQGVDLFEPLSFSGRRGSGLADGRDPYLDATLRPDGDSASWEKYRYTYRLWGRLLYNPDADPETWRRQLRREFGPAATSLEAALASASRILPLVTTAHHPSAANNVYWPDLYTNMPIVDEARPHPYRDTAVPRRFGTVSALDPELFSSVEEYVDELLSERPSGRYSPAEVARWLNDLAGSATTHLLAAESISSNPPAPVFRRWVIDIHVEVGLGRFFAAKLWAAIGYTLFRRTGDSAALREALAQYNRARAAWADVVALTQDAYKPDLTFGPEQQLRGHWADRLAAIDGDIEDMKAALDRANTVVPQQSGDLHQPAITFSAALLAQRPSVAAEHQPPENFLPGGPLSIVVTVAASDERPAAAWLHYRHANQAERFVTIAMEEQENGNATRFVSEIPGDYTQSPYPLLYYVEFQMADGATTLSPGFDTDLANQPYLLVRPRRQ